MQQLLTRVLYTLPGLVSGLVLHEFMHALSAWKLGDPTPREEGRLSLNPLRHLDPVGFLFLLAAGFGWAKPVRINRSFLRRPRRDEVIIALAGPLANLALGAALSAFLKIYFLVFPEQLFASFEPGVVFTIFLSALFINYALFVFNLIPIPPLDGSHLVFAALNVSPETEAKLSRYGVFFFLGLLVLSLIIAQATGMDYLSKAIRAVVAVVANFFFRLFGLPMVQFG